MGESDKDFLMIRYLSDNAVISAPEKAEEGRAEDNKNEWTNYNENLKNETNSNSLNAEDPLTLLTDRFKNSMLNLRRQSSIIKRKMLMENTYRMEPKPNQLFIWWKVKNAIDRLLTPVFENYKYDGKSAPVVCKTIAGKCVNLIKRKFDYPRYRYVCNVTLVQLRQQGVIISDRSLWNTSYDNNSVSVFKTRTGVCVVTFHAIYLE